MFQPVDVSRANQRVRCRGWWGNPTRPAVSCGHPGREPVGCNVALSAAKKQGSSTGIELFGIERCGFLRKPLTSSQKPGDILYKVTGTVNRSCLSVDGLFGQRQGLGRIGRQGGGRMAADTISRSTATTTTRLRQPVMVRRLKSVGRIVRKGSRARRA